MSSHPNPFGEISRRFIGGPLNSLKSFLFNFSGAAAVLLTGLLAGSVQALASDIPMATTGANGEAVVVSIAEDKMRSQLAQAMVAMHNSITPLLKAHDRSGPWMLERISVGVSTSLEVGIEYILKVGAVPRFVLTFTRGGAMTEDELASESGR